MLKIFLNTELVLTVLTTLDTLENDSKADVDNLDLFGDFNKL